MEISQAGKVYFTDSKEISPSICGLQKLVLLFFTPTRNYSSDGTSLVNPKFLIKNSTCI